MPDAPALPQGPTVQFPARERRLFGVGHMVAFTAVLDTTQGSSTLTAKDLVLAGTPGPAAVVGHATLPIGSAQASVV